MLLISHHVVFNPMASNDDLVTMSSIPGPDISCPKHTKLLFWYEVYPWKKVSQNISKCIHCIIFFHCVKWLIRKLNSFLTRILILGVLYHYFNEVKLKLVVLDFYFIKGSDTLIVLMFSDRTRTLASWWAIQETVSIVELSQFIWKAFSSQTSF